MCCFSCFYCIRSFSNSKSIPSSKNPTKPNALTECVQQKYCLVGCKEIRLLHAKSFSSILSLQKCMMKIRVFVLRCPVGNKNFLHHKRERWEVLHRNRRVQKNLVFIKHSKQFWAFTKMNIALYSHFTRCTEHDRHVRILE